MDIKEILKESALKKIHEVTEPKTKELEPPLVGSDGVPTGFIMFFVVIAFVGLMVVRRVSPNSGLGLLLTAIAAISHACSITG